MLGSPPPIYLPLSLVHVRFLSLLRRHFVLWGKGWDSRALGRDDGSSIVIFTSGVFIWKLGVLKYVWE